jgi:two-component sensor histidine kinase
LRDAERRVRSIALVHEILSRDPGDEVPFGEIIESLVRMAEDSVVSSHQVEISVVGNLGEVAADVATPLAVTIAELLQNAVEHAFPVDRALPEAAACGGRASPPVGSGRVGHVVVTLKDKGTTLVVEVRDDGCGVPEGFDIEGTSSLGLSIVRDLVESQLEGAITMERVPEIEGGGTWARIEVPVRSSGRA